MLNDLLKQANGELRVSQGREKAKPSDFKGQIVEVVDYERIEIVDSYTGEPKVLGVIATESNYFMVGTNLEGKIEKLETLAQKSFNEILSENKIEISITEKVSKNNRNYLDFKFV